MQSSEHSSLSHSPSVKYEQNRSVFFKDKACIVDGVDNKQGKLLA